MPGHFIARLLDGREVAGRRDKVVSFSHLEPGSVAEVLFTSETPGVPPVRVKADLARGERIHRFTRHAQRLNVRSAEEAKEAVEVFELQDADGQRICRLYYSPRIGPLLSTEDLYP